MIKNYINFPNNNRINIISHTNLNKKNIILNKNLKSNTHFYEKKNNFAIPIYQEKFINKRKSTNNIFNLTNINNFNKRYNNLNKAYFYLNSKPKNNMKNAFESYIFGKGKVENKFNIFNTKLNLLSI